MRPALETQLGHSPAMFLDRNELAELTGRCRSAAQARALKAMGIEHRLRPNGSIVVLRAHVEKLFGVASMPERRLKNTEPDWSAI
jgi:hypothetical protein